MAEPFTYLSKNRLTYQDGDLRTLYAYLGEMPEPIRFGLQGALREHYGVKEGPPVASTLDYLVSAVGG